MLSKFSIHVKLHSWLEYYVKGQKYRGNLRQGKKKGVFNAI